MSNKTLWKDLPNGGQYPEKKKPWPKAEKYLGQVQETKEYIAWLKRRRDNERLLRSDKAVHLTGMPRSDSPDLQKEQTRTVEIDELEERIAEAEAALEEQKKDIGKTILEKVSDPNGQAALIRHYILGLSWRNTGKAMGYGLTQMHRYKRASMAELEALLPEEDE